MDRGRRFGQRLIGSVASLFFAASIFQNCSRVKFDRTTDGAATEVQRPGPRNNGEAYDGKPYHLPDKNKECGGSPKATVNYQERTGTAHVMRENCEDLEAPRKLAAGEFRIFPDQPLVAIWDSQILLAEEMSDPAADPNRLLCYAYDHFGGDVIDGGISYAITVTLDLQSGVSGASFKTWLGKAEPSATDEKSFADANMQTQTAQPDSQSDRWDRDLSYIAYSAVFPVPASDDYYILYLGTEGGEMRQIHVEHRLTRHLNARYGVSYGDQNTFNLTCAF